MSRAVLCALDHCFADRPDEHEERSDHERPDAVRLGLTLEQEQHAPPEEQHVPEEAERQVDPLAFLEEILENCSIERASRVACLCFPSIVRDATTVPDL